MVSPISSRHLYNHHDFDVGRKHKKGSAGLSDKKALGLIHEIQLPVVTVVKPHLMREMWKALAAIGLCQVAYAEHRFRNAMAPKAVGMEDSTIQILGRWNCAAFLRYTRTPRFQFAAITNQLAQLS